jgi:hypothetical protein
MRMRKLSITVLLGLALVVTATKNVHGEDTNSPTIELQQPIRKKPDISLGKGRTDPTTHHEIQDNAYAVRQAHLGFIAKDVRFESDWIECGPVFAGSVLSPEQIYFFEDYRGSLLDSTDPNVASLAAFCIQGKKGGRGWVKNNQSVFELWIAVKRSDGTSELADLREPALTIGEYLWTLHGRSRVKMDPDKTLEEKIRSEISSRLKLKLEANDKVIIYGFRVQAEKFRLYAEPGYHAQE